MRQTFDETTSPDFGPRHVPLIRQAMRAQGLDGFLVPHEDEHQNEYLPAANDRLAWATGFTGSARAAGVPRGKGGGVLDRRHCPEVRDLMDGGVSAYLEEALAAGQTVGYDPRLHSPDALERLRAAAAKAGAALKPTPDNPLDQAWGPARPAQPQAPVVPHPLEFAGEASAEKRTRIGLILGEQGADAA